MKQPDIWSRLRKRGARMTKTRVGVLEIFGAQKKPLCVNDILSKLKSRGLSVNKTTVYREVDFLVQQDILEVLNFDENQKYYELKGDHHHHLVCRVCGMVEEVDMHGAEQFFQKIERRLKRKTSFSDVRHSLEFFGLCAQCH